MMTSRERILAAMRREDVDRIPLSPRMSDVIAQYYQSEDVWAYKRFKKEYFDCDPDLSIWFPVENPFDNVTSFPTYLNNVELTIDYADKGDHFLVSRLFTTPAGNISDKTIVPKPGIKTYGISPNPHKVEHLIKGPEDLERLRYIFPPLHGRSFVPFHHAVQEMGEEGLVLMSVPGPMDYLGGEAYPMEQMMIDYYEHPQFFDAIIKIFADYSIGMVKTALENDVRNFFLVYFYPSLSTGWSPNIIKEKFAPIIKKQTDMIHGCGGIADYYDDGKLMESIDIFIGAGVDVIETCSPPPVGDFCLKEAKKRWGNKAAFKGLVDMINIIWRGTPEQIETHVRDIVEQNGDKRGLILGTMDNIRPETSDENITAYFQAANKYR